MWSQRLRSRQLSSGRPRRSETRMRFPSPGDAQRGQTPQQPPHGLRPLQRLLIMQRRAAACSRSPARAHQQPGPLHQPRALVALAAVSAVMQATPRPTQHVLRRSWLDGCWTRGPNAGDCCAMKTRTLRPVHLCQQAQTRNGTHIVEIVDQLFRPYVHTQKFNAYVWRVQAGAAAHGARAGRHGGDGRPAGLPAAAAAAPGVPARSASLGTIPFARCGRAVA